MVAELPKVGSHQKTHNPHWDCVFCFLQRSRLELFLEKILSNEDFYHHYQPIYDIQSGVIFGYEGLFRTKYYSNPEDVFSVAKKNEKLYELDSRSVHKALLTYINADISLRFKNLFLNVFPTTVTNPQFITLINQIINENHISSQQLIMEINENQIIDLEYFKMAINSLKNMGVLIAIDDFGKGYSSFMSVIELNPDFIKLDKYFLEGLIRSEKKKYIIQTLLNYSRKFNTKLIVEGIEDEHILLYLQNIGIKYAQGFLLGKPHQII